MTDDARSARERKFWNRHTKILSGQGIKPDFSRWYILRAKQFIKAYPGRRLVELGPDDITGYLMEAEREGSNQPWQFHQIVDAIRILYSIVRTDWSEKFDWEYWRDSSRTLDAHQA